MSEALYCDLSLFHCATNHTRYFNFFRQLDGALDMKSLTWTIESALKLAKTGPHGKLKHH